jgi:hypothetical protein
MRLPNSPIHYRYWILILIAAVILVMAEKWSARDNFTVYLSNAATLTSLLLGMVAIFYAYISNESISTSLGKVEGISKGLEEVKSQISAELVESNKTADLLSGYTDTLAGLTYSLTSDIAKLPGVIDELRGESLQLQGKVESMDASLIELCETAALAYKGESTAEFTPQQIDDEQGLTAFAQEVLDRSDIVLSFMIAVISLYHRSHRNGQLAIKELAELCHCPAPVMVSFIGFLSSLQLIKFSFTRGGQKSLSPVVTSYLHEALSSGSLGNFYSKIEKYDLSSEPMKYNEFLEEVISALGQKGS